LSCTVHTLPSSGCASLIFGGLRTNTSSGVLSCPSRMLSAMDAEPSPASSWFSDVPRMGFSTVKSSDRWPGRSASLRPNGESSRGDMLRRCGESSGDDACDIARSPGPPRWLPLGTKLNLSAPLFWLTLLPTTPIGLPCSPALIPRSPSGCLARLCAHIPLRAVLRVWQAPRQAATPSLSFSHACSPAHVCAAGQRTSTARAPRTPPRRAP